MLFQSLANFLCFFTILERICFAKFVNTIKIFLSNNKNIFLRTFWKISLIILSVLHKFSVYEMRDVLLRFFPVCSCKESTGQKGSYKVFDDWVKYCLINLLVWRQTFPWSGKKTFDIIKETGGWILSQKLFVMDWNSKFCDNRNITFSISEPIQLAARKKSWIFAMVF